MKLTAHWAAVVAIAVATAASIPVLTHADGSFDSRLFADTNADGCSTHSWSDSLAAIAQQRAQSIADSGDFTNRLEPGVGDENIGWSSNVTDPVAAADTINRAYMNSPEHKANICDTRYGAMGIGSVFRSSWQGKNDVWIDAEEFGVGGAAAPPAAAPPQRSAPQPAPQQSAPGGLAVPSTGGAG